MQTPCVCENDEGITTACRNVAHQKIILEYFEKVIGAILYTQHQLPRLQMHLSGVSEAFPDRWHLREYVGTIVLRHELQKIKYTESGHHFDTRSNVFLGMPSVFQQMSVAPTSLADDAHYNHAIQHFNATHLGNFSALH